ncbi:MAG TPA: hypothetical protein PK724_06745, partial [Pseudomonadales bacterium]|nr:hypothetical protein [Pseudomonadales bacterium]
QQRRGGQREQQAARQRHFFSQIHYSYLRTLLRKSYYHCQTKINSSTTSPIGHPDTPKMKSKPIHPQPRCKRRWKMDRIDGQSE